MDASNAQICVVLNEFWPVFEDPGDDLPVLRRVRAHFRVRFERTPSRRTQLAFFTAVNTDLRVRLVQWAPDYNTDNLSMHTWVDCVLYLVGQDGADALRAVVSSWNLFYNRAYLQGTDVPSCLFFTQAEYQEAITWDEEAMREAIGDIE